jgi:CheY-like chemotaxis protein
VHASGAAPDAPVSGSSTSGGAATTPRVKEDTAMMQTLAPRAALVVEDDADIRAFECQALEDEGFTVLEAYDGTRALECLRTYPEPLVVVLDWRLPGLNGDQILQAMAAEGAEAAPRVYLVVTAAYDTSAFRALRLPSAPVVEVMGKPVHLEMLLSAVARAASQLPAGRSADTSCPHRPPARAGRASSRASGPHADGRRHPRRRP